MSVQFGRWNFNGKPVEQDYLEKVQSLLLPYGPDDRGSYSNGAVSMVHCGFHTTRESRREKQPLVMASGAIITCDGRLDNRIELIRQLGDTVTSDSTDVSIVAAAYAQWGSDCFAHLIGDWALAVWEPRTGSLTLAKDPIGVRHLYYSFDENQVIWSSILDPLVLFAGKKFPLCEEYIAGWFSFFPATHLTPYVGIHSVPPSSFVVLRPGNHKVTKYWDFDPGNRIRYRTDTEYEEHFRAVFGQAVRRRLRSDSPILAELSGGMDSSSIVCMADTIIARGDADTPRLDTVSYYDDSEPNWNERPYFTKIEERRGRIGCDIDVGQQQFIDFTFDNCRFMATPNALSGRPNKASRQFAACLIAQQNRVVLSGVGGDEVMGGVPTAIPELADLLANGQFRAFAHQIKMWALNKRIPWLRLLFETLREFLPPAFAGVPQHLHPASWIKVDFAKHHRDALRGYESRIRLCGPRPSFQNNLAALDILRRQLACSVVSREPLYEKSYPYLDRCLLEFAYAIPREQLVRPGHRRSLMRRSLVGIVPDEILNRKRKAYVARATTTTISAEWVNLIEMCRHMICDSLNIVDSEEFVNALHRIREGQEATRPALMRTIGMELWLRSLMEVPYKGIAHTASLCVVL